MKPYADRTVDTQYQELLSRILKTGREVHPIQGGMSKMVMGHQMRFDMKNGFPLITERDMSGPFLKAALGEHIAFLNGARTQEELESFGCKFWDRWVTKENVRYLVCPRVTLVMVRTVQPGLTSLLQRVRPSTRLNMS